ncbi:IS4 family transposase, partial [Salegentibacter sp. JZCK2]|nr:IS4 family transposase [Salegentibacter tibetensis]
KSFFGTSLNAVYTQIWIAVSAYLIIAIMKKRLKIELELYTIFQILSISLFEKVTINQLLNNKEYRKNINDDYNQLKMFNL